MTRGKKIGVVLMLSGLCIPILAMLFSSGYVSRQDLIWNAQHIEIILWEIPIPIKYEVLAPPPSDQDGPWKKYKRVKIPQYNTYADFPVDLPQAEMERALNEKFPSTVTRLVVLPGRYFFGLGLILTAIGLGLLSISKNGKTRTN